MPRFCLSFPNPPSRLTLLPLVAALVMTVLVACSPGPGEGASLADEAVQAETDASTVDAQAPAVVEGIVVSDAWTRAMAPGAKVAGGFMTLRNEGGGDDRLVSVASPAAERVEIHEMRMADGVMQMRHLADGLPLPAGSEVVLRPGDYHLMFFDPAEPFVEGGEIPVTLNFEHTGELEVVFKVMGLGATSSMPEDTEHEDRH
ncbi:copper chaperone PCu(A)C [Marilutibacter alkalisoli]|uniref:Copper chaperone PCu(A)C n=1 Tax=Marilutibacter alkalisoli TaxID=2591633 RepID=A0A514BPK4_9GAMM|nr:copper chaperone PCu(A)C [Lysobacter alkalisoli]QDH69312.1 copper chaperone PCu(A)C [Lysobacter alkalisoli]